MGSLDERVAYLEGRMEDLTTLMADVRADMTELGFEIHRLDHKIDRHFMWLAGRLVGFGGYEKIVGRWGLAACCPRTSSR